VEGWQLLTKWESRLFFVSHRKWYAGKYADAGKRGGEKSPLVARAASYMVLFSIDK
jgi:hypothetical protein